MSLARKAIAAADRIAELETQVDALQTELQRVKQERDTLRGMLVDTENRKIRNQLLTALRTGRVP